MSSGAAPAPIGAESMRLQQLRTAFDQTFALAPSAEAGPVTSLLAIRVASKPFVLRSEQITGLVKPNLIVPFPSSIPEAIGIAGIRGVLVPAFHLAPFLQLKPSPGTPHWLVLAHPESPIGLAFDEFEGQVEVARSALYSELTHGGTTNSGLLARIGASVRAVIDVPQIVEEVRRKAGLSGPARSTYP